MISKFLYKIKDCSYLYEISIQISERNVRQNNTFNNF